MKTLIATVMLLVFASPAFAAKADIRQWRELNWQCYDDPRSEDDLDVEITQQDYDKTRRGKICLAAKALKKKLATEVSAADPYQEGMRNYREGLCYRARPYSSNTEEGKLWERGYDAAQKQRDTKYRHRRYVEWPPNCHVKGW